MSTGHHFTSTLATISAPSFVKKNGENVIFRTLILRIRIVKTVTKSVTKNNQFFKKYQL